MFSNMGDKKYITPYMEALEMLYEQVLCESIYQDVDMIPEEGYM